MFRLALLQWLAAGLVGSIIAAPVDERKPYGRVCIAVVTDEIEEPLQASSKPGAKTHIVVHADANEHCQMLVFAFNARDGKLAHDWRPQFVELPPWEEVLRPKGSKWEWSAGSEPFDVYVLFMQPNSEEARELKVLITAMLNPTVDRELLGLQSVKLVELVTRSVAGQPEVIDVAKVSRGEPGVVYRADPTFPWRDYASGANFTEAKPGLLIFRVGYFMISQ
jgi:hypothetical protein